MRRTKKNNNKNTRGKKKTQHKKTKDQKTCYVIKTRTPKFARVRNSTTPLGPLAHQLWFFGVKKRGQLVPNMGNIEPNKS